MNELRQILELWAEAEPARQPAVLATVVKTQGSSYRLPGARLLLLSNGKRAGSVSGGCLEDDLIKKAWWLTQAGPIVRRYDTTPQGEISTSYGLGCNGIIHVFLERVTSDNSVLPLLRDVRHERRAAAIAHVIAPSGLVGQRLILHPSGGVIHNVADPDLASQLAMLVQRGIHDGVSGNVRVNGETEAFIETLAPPIRLLVFGAGDDAVPLTRLAKLLGWSVSVLDGRAHYARPEKFPEADEVRVWSAARGDAIPAIDAWTVAVLMTHSYAQDRETLRALSPHPLKYLGILGPQQRSSQLLADAGLDTSKIAPRLHSPVGLDIGADGPEQVALSIVAEIQAVLNGREGGFLRARNASIHARDQESEWRHSIACA